MTTLIPNLSPETLAQRYALLCDSTRPEPNEQMLAYSVERGLQTLDQLLSKDLRKLARQGAPDDFADIHQALLSELERLREFCAFPALAQKFVVAFGGGFSAGKSSLINGVLGQKLLVTEVDPTTSLPTYLLHGEANEVSALNLFGHRIRLSEEAFLSLTHDEASRYGSHISRLLRAAFITRREFAWPHLALIDTPGYSKDDSDAHSERTDEHIARTQLNAAQAVVWVIDARQGCITEDDLAFLSGLRRDIPLFIALSRADQKPEAEIPKIENVIRTALTERNIPFNDIAPISARKPQSWPLEPLLKQLNKWNTQHHQLRFLDNFRLEFVRYDNFLTESEHQSLRHLNRLNRILSIADNKDVQEDAQELKQGAKTQLQIIRNQIEQLKNLQADFFAHLEKIGKLIDIDFSKSINELKNVDKPNLLNLLAEQRTLQGKSTPDEPEVLRDLMTGNKRKMLLEVDINSIQNLMRNHFIFEMDEHEKNCYAYLLTLMLGGFDEVTKKQSQIFLIILNKIGFDDIRKELFDNIKSFEPVDLYECQKILIKNKIEKSFIFDSLMIFLFGKIEKSNQIQLISEMAFSIGIHDDLKKSLAYICQYAIGCSDIELEEDVDISSFKMWDVFLPHNQRESKINIATTENLPEYLQMRIASDKDDKVVAALASNKTLSQKLIFDLISTGSPDVKKSLAKNTILPTDLQMDFFKNGDNDIKMSLATNQSISSELQNFLAKESSWTIRSELASNPSINAEIIKTLSEDDDLDVRASLAKNPTINLNLMMRFLTDEKTKVRKYLAQNVSIPESIQSKILNESDEFVKAELAKNPSLCENIQYKILNNLPAIKSSLAKNKNIGIAVQKALLSSSDIETKVNLYENKFTDSSIKISIENLISSDDFKKENKKWTEKMKESLELVKESMAAHQNWSNYAMKEYDQPGWFSSWRWSQSECDYLENKARDIDKKIKEVDEDADLSLRISNSLQDILRIKNSRNELKSGEQKISVSTTSDSNINAEIEKQTESSSEQSNWQSGNTLCAGDGFPELVVLPGGSFQMGGTGYSDEQPIHTVHMNSFSIGKYPITQGQWKKVMGNNPSHFSGDGDQCPVENVSWDDAQAFIKKLNQQTGHTYRLPSEAEWEYACRAGSTAKWCFGDNESQLKHYAWYDDNSDYKTHPVGQKEPNAFGLYDMHGNVWEWCEDCWHDNYQDAPSDGHAWMKEGYTDRRVLRGGSWYKSIDKSRSAYRTGNPSDTRYGDSYGFRVARSRP